MIPELKNIIDRCPVCNAFVPSDPRDERIRELEEKVGRQRDINNDLKDTNAKLFGENAALAEENRRLREALGDIGEYCYWVKDHDKYCACDRCIINRIARKAMEE